MNKLKKLLSLPGPKELGRAKYNALPMRSFQPFVKGYCWEDFDIEVKKLYPIRYWIDRVIFRWLSQKVYNLRMFYYHWRSILIDKDHLIDLRQKGCDFYDGGYLDEVTQILYANFTILVKLVDSKEFKRTSAFYKNESDEDKCDKKCKDDIREMESLHHYWTIERGMNSKYLSKLHRDLENFLDDENKYEKAWKKIHAFSQKISDEEDDNLIRLIKIRKSMWI